MKLLLDTHILLWWCANSRRLGPQARRIISHAEVVYVSAASAWEISIKLALGRLRLPETPATLLEENRFDELPVTFHHAEQLFTLPLHHADPFDRMLVAQAQTEDLTLVTGDPQMAPYQVPLVWARP